ncbi:MAG: endonuclease, partial [Marinilabiliales bacterium]|nr:endonuclease [Marinilabiliales bacterium]
KLVNLACCWNNRNPGTIRTKGKWEIFDQFIVSQSLLSGGSLKMDLSQTMICTEAFLLEPDKRYLGKKPFRTYLGPIYHGGTSDHLPIVATLVAKE